MNKRCVVLGGALGCGIAEEIVSTLGREGWRVAGGAHERATWTAESIDAALGDEVPEVVVAVVAVRDEPTAFLELGIARFREAVTEPVAHVTVVARQVVTRWMEDAEAGVLAFVLRRPEYVDATAAALETALAGFVRSVAKEHGRRGVRALLFVGEDGDAADVAACLAVLISEPGALVTGETIHASGALRA